MSDDNSRIRFSRCCDRNVLQRSQALAHWERVKDQARRELCKAKGERRHVIRRRIEAAATRIGVITQHLEILLALAEAERRKREQQAEGGTLLAELRAIASPSDGRKCQGREACVPITGEAASPRPRR